MSVPDQIPENPTLADCRPVPKWKTVIDMTGLRYDRWLVLGYLGRADGRNALWLCRCDCGTERAVSGPSLRYGATLSCGCLKVERSSEALTTHGMSSTPTYRSRAGMIARCTNPNEVSYPDYGGRGIAVCARWMESFENFLADMGPCPPGMTIERMDNSLGYGPGNCVWASRKQQNRNKRSTRYLTHEGLTLSLAEWAERTPAIPYHTIKGRLVRGWTDADALTIPVGSVKPGPTPEMGRVLRHG